MKKNIDIGNKNRNKLWLIGQCSKQNHVNNKDNQILIVDLSIDH